MQGHLSLSENVFTTVKSHVKICDPGPWFLSHSNLKNSDRCKPVEKKKGTEPSQSLFVEFWKNDTSIAVLNEKVCKLELVPNSLAFAQTSPISFSSKPYIHTLLACPLGKQKCYFSEKKQISRAQSIESNSLNLWLLLVFPALLSRGPERGEYVVTVQCL